MNFALRVIFTLTNRGSKMRFRSLLMSAFALAMLSEVGSSQTVQVGTPQPGGGNDCLLFVVNCFNRAQHIYSSSYFTDGPVMINSISFYGVGSDGGTNFSFYLSTSQNAVGSGSSTFAENIGADNQLFFSGVLPTSVGNMWTFTGTPFYYDPSAGDLLLDEFKVGGGTYVGNQNAYTVQIQRIFAANVNDEYANYNENDGYGPVTTFATSAAVVATPEPASLVLVATGMVGLIGVARRRRAA
jgi:hypothetical protein